MFFLLYMDRKLYKALTTKVEQNRFLATPFSLLGLIYSLNPSNIIHTMQAFVTPYSNSSGEPQSIP